MHSSKSLPRNNDQGFSLIELLITISLMIIISSMAMPSFNSLINRQQAKTQFNHLHQLLLATRTTAIKQSRTLTICPTTNQQQCTNHKQWQDKLMIFHDENNNKTLDDNENLISVHSLDKKASIHNNRKSPIRFNALGHLSSGANTLSYCYEELHLGLTISSTGRTRIASDQNLDGKEDEKRSYRVNIKCN